MALKEGLRSHLCSSQLSQHTSQYVNVWPAQTQKPLPEIFVGFLFFFLFLCGLPKNTKGRRQWHPTPELLPGKFHGWRSLVGSVLQCSSFFIVQLSHPSMTTGKTIVWTLVSKVMSLYFNILSRLLIIFLPRSNIF